MPDNGQAQDDNDMRMEKELVDDMRDGYFPTVAVFEVQMEIDRLREVRSMSKQILDNLYDTLPR